MDHERIHRRVHGRKQAESILSLLDLPHRDCVEAFVAELRANLLPEETAVAARKQELELAELAGMTLKFGQHQGERLDNIDREYLAWLADSSMETAETVGRYLEMTEEE